MNAQPLEPSVPEMRQMLATAGERVIAYLSNLGQEAASGPAGHGPVAAMAMPPAAAQPLDTLLDHLFNDLLPSGVNSAGPGYLGYVPGGGLFHSALADFVTKCVNRHAGHESMAPGLVRLEWNVVRWLCSLLCMPDSAGGVLTTGGSMSNLMAIVAARVDRLPENFLSGVIYVSEQCHHSVRRAARTAGFPVAQVRRLPTDDRFRISLPHLAQAVRADRQAGLQPFMVVGSAGTTNTGAVDDLNGLADLARDEGLWLHVDGAYGGFFMLNPEGRRLLAGIERADSVALDPHKGLGLPYGTGSLVVRDRALLRRAFGEQERAGYLPALQDDEINFCDMSPELSREVRGIRLWLPLQLCGVEAFAAHLDEKLQLARQAARELRQVPGLELIDEPQLSTVVFRLGDRPGAQGDFDAETHELLRRVNARGHVFLSPTTLRGRVWIRLCVLSFRSHQEHVETALRDIRASVAEILDARAGSRPQVLPASAVDPVALARLIAQSFAAREPLAVATGVTADEFFDFAVQVVAACTRSPLSFVSCDAATGAVTGFCMAADLLHVPVISAGSVAPSLRPTLALLDQLGQAYARQRGPARAGEVVELVVTGVRPGQMGYLVASMLEKQALAAARDRGFVRAVTICTHRVTAQLAQRTGFQRLIAQPYASFEFARRHVFASIGSAHGEAAVYERSLVEAPAARARPAPARVSDALICAH